MAESQPEKTQQLLKQLENWRAEISAPVPTEKNPKFDAEAEKLAIQDAGKIKKRKKKKKI